MTDENIAIRRASLQDAEALAPLFDSYRQFYGQGLLMPPLAPAAGSVSPRRVLVRRDAGTAHEITEPLGGVASHCAHVGETALEPFAAAMSPRVRSTLCTPVTRHSVLPRQPHRRLPKRLRHRRTFRARLAPMLDLLAQWLDGRLGLAALLVSDGAPVVAGVTRSRYPWRRDDSCTLTGRTH